MQARKKNSSWLGKQLRESGNSAREGVNKAKKSRSRVTESGMGVNKRAILSEKRIF